MLTSRNHEPADRSPEIRPTKPHFGTPSYINAGETAIIRLKKTSKEAEPSHGVDYDAFFVAEKQMERMKKKQPDGEPESFSDPIAGQLLQAGRDSYGQDTKKITNWLKKSLNHGEILNDEELWHPLKIAIEKAIEMAEEDEKKRLSAEDQRVSMRTKTAIDKVTQMKVRRAKEASEENKAIDARNKRRKDVTYETAKFEVAREIQRRQPQTLARAQERAREQEQSESAIQAERAMAKANAIAARREQAATEKLESKYPLEAPDVFMQIAKDYNDKNQTEAGKQLLQSLFIEREEKITAKLREIQEEIPVQKPKGFLGRLVQKLTGAGAEVKKLEEKNKRLLKLSHDAKVFREKVGLPKVGL